VSNQDETTLYKLFMPPALMQQALEATKIIAFWLRHEAMFAICNGVEFPVR